MYCDVKHADRIISASYHDYADIIHSISQRFNQLDQNHIFINYAKNFNYNNRDYEVTLNYVVRNHNFSFSCSSLPNIDMHNLFI